MKAIRLVIASLVAVWAGFVLPAFAGSDHDTCLGCHGDKTSGAPFVQPHLFERSIHQGLSCADCHEGITEYPHPTGRRKVQCATCHEEKAGSFRLSHHGKFWKDVTEPAACLKCHGSPHAILPPSDDRSPVSRVKLPETCGKCHPQVVKEYLESVHGTALRKGVQEAPVCTSCHGEHQFLGPRDADSPVSAQRIPDTCSQCHGSLALAGQFKINPDVAKTYQGGFHGLALKAGVKQAANCASCHGVHNILPPSDPRSSVNPANLAQTCSKCHPGAGPGVIQGRMHENPRDTEQKTPINFIKWLYLWLIILTVGGMASHNALDFIYKLTHPGHSLYPEAFYFETRLEKVERIQHALLAGSFVLLAYTGFAHTWPKAWWASPFAWEDNGAAIRHWVHMGAATILLGTSLFHLAYLAFSERGRRQLVSILPAMHDLGDLSHRLLYLLGRRKAPPPHRHFTYIEKAEYWALVWGTGVMGLTGLFVFFKNWSLGHMPKMLLDVFLTIHFWEAVLASLAIPVWHFYWVLFDPDVYPMNWSWLIGKPRRKGPKSPR